MNRDLAGLPVAMLGGDRREWNWQRHCGIED